MSNWLRPSAAWLEPLVERIEIAIAEGDQDKGRRRDRDRGEEKDLRVRGREQPLAERVDDVFADRKQPQDEQCRLGRIGEAAEQSEADEQAENYFGSSKGDLQALHRGEAMIIFVGQ